MVIYEIVRTDIPRPVPRFAQSKGEVNHILRHMGFMTNTKGKVPAKITRRLVTNKRDLVDLLERVALGVRT